MGKIHDALERYLKEKNRSTESKHPKNAGPDIHSQNFSLGSTLDLFLKGRHEKQSSLPQNDLPGVRNYASESRITNVHAEGLELYELEKEFAKQIVSKLELRSIKNIIKYKYFIVLHDFLKFTGGELLKFDGQDYYRLNFKFRVPVSIFVDQNGKARRISQTRKKNHPCPDTNPIPLNLLDTGKIMLFENLFFQSLFKSFDMENIKNRLKDIFCLNLSEKIACREGSVVVLGDRITLEFIMDVSFGFSIFLDEAGNYLDAGPSGNYSEWKNVVKEYIIRPKFISALNLFKNQTQRR